MACSFAASSVSIITFPTKKIRDGATPSLARFSTPAGSDTKRTSLMESVSLRLISSGMSSSKLRSPASTWIMTGRRRSPKLDANGRSRTNFAVTSAHAIVEFTSPTDDHPVRAARRR